VKWQWQVMLNRALSVPQFRSPSILLLAAVRSIVCQGRLDRIRADYPNPIERFFRYPTLHWFFSSDAALRHLISGGSLAGFILVVLGVHSRLGFMIMWAVYLSFSNMMGFMYPW
jgi:hypothetical protein